MICNLSSKMVGAGQKDFSKTSCGGSENFDFKERLYVGWLNFLRGGYREFLEKIENYIIAV